MISTPRIPTLPGRAAKALEGFIPPEDLIKQRVAKFVSVQPRTPDKEGYTEVLDGVTFTHHFATTPGDYETIDWHYVSAGSPDNEAIIFLHGIPDSWYQWHHQMAALSASHHCIAVDLKGYGQSEKRPGDYGHEAVSEQMNQLLQQIGLTSFNLTTHDRGTVQAAFIAANHTEAVLRYAKREQHLYHFNPSLAPP